MTVRRTGNWNLAEALLRSLPGDVRRATDDALGEEAEEFLGRAKKAIATSGASNNATWPPNTSATLAGKSGRKTLKDSGALSRAMIVRRKGRGKYVVTFKGLGGVSSAEMQKRAGVHERGATITQTVTSAQHKAVMAKLAKSGRSGGGSGKFRPGAVMVIRIPKRSFLAATKKAHFSPAKLRRRIKRKLRLNLIKYKPLM